jgi:hypothetical protein
MYKKKAAKPKSGNMTVLRVIFGFGDSVGHSIGYVHPAANVENGILQLYVLPISLKQYLLKPSDTALRELQAFCQVI